MKKLKFVFVLFIILVAINSCEKDDICVDGSTPLLLIRFYDNTDTTNFKTPPNLKIKGQLTEGDFGSVIPNTSADSIQIPLRIDALNTVFSLTTNTTTDAANDNEDVITFNYTTKDLFISRACGFIVNYEDLSQTLETDSNNWIKRIVIVNKTIKNQNTAHVKIFH